MDKHNKHNHHKMMMKDFKKRFWVSILLTIPILILSPLIQSFIGLDFDFSSRDYSLFLFSSIIFFYGGFPFLKGIYKELSNKSPGMMTLIAVAITVAYLYSSAVVFGLKGKFFFWELATLIDVMLLGHYIEMKSVIGASNAIEKLAELMPNIAHRKQNDKIEDIEIKNIKKGDILLVKPGEKIPADGVIIKGKGYINESMLTGESKPVLKEENDEIIGGSINQDSSLEIKVAKTGEDSYLSKVIEMVNEAQKTKSKTQNLADKAAFYLTIVALSAGIITLVVWAILGKSFVFSIERMATVMVITCPHALGLAIPLVAAISTTLSAKNGLLIRNRTSFENARNITTVVFDKTGTLTVGDFGVTEIKSFSEKYDKKKIVKIAASLEQNSEHPIAKGMMNKAEEMKLETMSVKDFKNIKGEGVEGKIGDDSVKVVSPGYIKDNNLDIPENNRNKPTNDTIVYLVINNEVIGLIALADKIREDSMQAIKQLQKAKIKCWMITGDNEGTAKEVADQLELDGFFAEVLPHEKQDKIKSLQEKGEFVAMAGDGVNDAPALAQADVGIAIGSGTDVAAETADIVLVNSNPADVNRLIKFGKTTYKKMVQNLFWATGYNVIAIPLAAGVLFNYEIVISPALGAALMSLSTVIVAINAKLLKF